MINPIVIPYNRKQSKSFPEDDIFVSMVEFKDNLFVCTNKNVYKLNDKGNLELIEFQKID